MNLTIVTASYNNIGGLINVIDSLNNQTYKDFDHIIVDDCSSEIDHNKLNELCGENNRRYFIKSYVRCHYYGAIMRNIGAMAAFSFWHSSKRDIDNEWIIFLDNDNTLLPNHIEEMVETANSNPEATLIASDMELVGRTDKEFRQVRKCEFKHCGCDLGQFMYKTKLFREYGYFFPHPHRKHKYDWELIKKITDGEAGKIAYTNQPTFIMNYKKR